MPPSHTIETSAARCAEVKDLVPSEITELDPYRPEAQELARIFLGDFTSSAASLLNRETQGKLREAVETRLRELIDPENPEVDFQLDADSPELRYTTVVSNIQKALGQPGSELLRILKFLQILRKEQADHEESLKQKPVKIQRAQAYYQDEFARVGDDSTADKKELNRRKVALTETQKALEKAEEKDPLQKYLGQDLASLLQNHQRAIKKQKTAEIRDWANRDIGFTVGIAQEKEKVVLRTVQAKEKKKFFVRYRLQITLLLALLAGVAGYQIFGTKEASKQEKGKITQGSFRNRLNDLTTYGDLENLEKIIEELQSLKSTEIAAHRARLAEVKEAVLEGVKTLGLDFEMPEIDLSGSLSAQEILRRERQYIRELLSKAQEANNKFLESLATGTSNKSSNRIVPVLLLSADESIEDQLSSLEAEHGLMPPGVKEKTVREINQVLKMPLPRLSVVSREGSVCTLQTDWESGVKYPEVYAGLSVRVIGRGLSQEIITPGDKAILTIGGPGVRCEAGAIIPQARFMHVFIFPLGPDGKNTRYDIEVDAHMEIYNGFGPL